MNTVDRNGNSLKECAAAVGSLPIPVNGKMISAAAAAISVDGKVASVKRKMIYVSEKCGYFAEIRLV